MICQVAIFIKLICPTVWGSFFLFCQNYMDDKLFCQNLGDAHYWWQHICHVTTSYSINFPHDLTLEHLQQFCILSLAKHRVCQVSNQYGHEKKKLPPMVWQSWVGKTQSVDLAIILSDKNFLRAIDSKVQATVGTNTQTLGTMETRCTGRMNPWPWRMYLPHSRLDEHRLPHSRRWCPAMCRTKRSRSPTFRGKKTGAAGEPRVGKENAWSYAMPNAIHGWHICQTWPEICQVNQNAKPIC